MRDPRFFRDPTGRLSNNLKPPAHNVHFSPEDFFQFFLHVNKVKQGMSRTFVKRHEHINVAVRAEVSSEHRTEKGEFSYLPLLAKFDYFFFWYFNMCFTHYSHLLKLKYQKKK